MGKSRFSLIIVSVVLLHCLSTGSAFAGFGFGGYDGGASGLDFNKGYDVNTVVTVSGRVTSLPHAGEQDHLIVEVSAGGEIVNISLGPKSFWEKKDLTLHLNDDISAKGSKAQGKDGKTYMMAQKLTNKTTGAQALLRGDRGAPAWSGRNATGSMSNRPSGGMFRGGGMMRGGGGMMHR